MTFCTHPIIMMAMPNQSPQSFHCKPAHRTVDWSDKKNYPTNQSVPTGEDFSDAAQTDSRLRIGRTIHSARSKNSAINTRKRFQQAR